MIISSLFGGLGNQLFQYACGRAVAERLKVDLMLDTNILSGKFTGRDFELHVFNIRAQIAPLQEVRKYVPNLFETPKWFHQFYRVKRCFNGRHIFIERVYQRHGYIRAIEQVKDNTYLYGYFQAEKFFRHIRTELLDELQLKPEITLDEANKSFIERIEGSNSVSVHVRRGDYLQSNFTSLDMNNYYEKAIEHICSRVKEPTFYIFSNDVEWVRKNFNRIKYPYEVVDINTGAQSYMDLILMSRCKHNIIANSSFSWWGAWLNRNPDKQIIAPWHWYKNESHNTNELLPAEWHKIKSKP